VRRAPRVVWKASTVESKERKRVEVEEAASTLPIVLSSHLPLLLPSLFLLLLLLLSNRINSSNNRRPSPLITAPNQTLARSPKRTSPATVAEGATNAADAAEGIDEPTGWIVRWR